MVVPLLVWLILAFIVLLLLCLLVLVFLNFQKLSIKNETKLLDELRYLLAPTNISYEVNDLAELAIEVWRLELRLQKIFDNLDDPQKKSITMSLAKIKRYFEKQDIETVDFTNKKYNEGLSLEVLSIEKEKNLIEEIIKETIEPSVLFKGKVIKKAKVIVKKREE